MWLWRHEKSEIKEMFQVGYIDVCIFVAFEDVLILWFWIFEHLLFNNPFYKKTLCQTKFLSWEIGADYSANHIMTSKWEEKHKFLYEKSFLCNIWRSSFFNMSSKEEVFSLKEPATQPVARKWFDYAEHYSRTSYLIWIWCDLQNLGNVEIENLSKDNTHSQAFLTMKS